MQWVGTRTNTHTESDLEIVRRETKILHRHPHEAHGVFKHCIITVYMHFMGANGDWDFQISDLVKNPDGTDI